MPYAAYVRQFSWNMAKYPTKQPLRAIAETISKMVSHADIELRSKSQAYNNLKTNLQNMERKTRFLQFSFHFYTIFLTTFCQWESFDEKFESDCEKR